MLIFLRIPTRCVFKFRLVSRRWKEILSHPSFCAKFRSKLTQKSSNSSIPLLGFFQSTSSSYTSASFDQIPRISLISTKKLKPRTFMESLGFVLSGSSNGLILCGQHPDMYFICNPITDKWYSLRPPIKLPPVDCINIGFSYQHESYESDGTASVGHRFRVVRTNNGSSIADNLRLKKFVFVETCSSESLDWKETAVTGSEPFVIVSGWPCTVMKGVFFFSAIGEGKENISAVYDVENSENQLWLMDQPKTPGFSGIPVFGESADGFLQCAKDDSYEGGFSTFRIFKLRKRLQSYSFSSKITEEEWEITHTVKYPVPILHKPNKSTIPWGPAGDPNPVSEEVKKKYPFLIGFHPENPGIIFLSIGSVFYQVDLNINRFNKEKKFRKEVIQYHNVAYPWMFVRYFPYFEPEWPPSPVFTE